MTRIWNRIATAVLDKLIELVPERQPEPGKKVENPPPVWRYTIEDYATGTPYLTRVLFPWIPILGCRPMLHKFHRPDGDRALHNHPWKWSLSVVLAGEYMEDRVLPDESQMYGAPWYEARLVRWFNYLRDTDFHRITELRGNVYTLFVTGPRTQDWGFLSEDATSLDDVVQWRTYIDLKRAELASSTATGAALDAIAATFNIERDRHFPAESDADLRERIRATLQGLLT